MSRGSGVRRQESGLRFSAILFSFLIITFAAFAQEVPFITVSAPTEQIDGLFTTVSAPAAEKANTEAVRPVPVAPAKPAASPVPGVPKKSVTAGGSGKWEQELLRDPFWPVGFYPDGWQKRVEVRDGTDGDTSGWKAAHAKLLISGTSRLGGKMAAIINGEMKSAGDKVDVFYEGRTYQWQIIETNGQLQLKRLGLN